MDAIVGYTGFVGGNLCLSHNFDCKYNSKNISEAFGTKPDLLVYAGVRSEKYLANHDPLADMDNIRAAFENIVKISPRRLVHISTVDVFKRPKDVTEKTPVDIQDLNAYGFDRYVLEAMLRDRFPDCHIIRLPGLYGEGLKKNFIYDMINPVPTMLNDKKYAELRSDLTDAYYQRQDNGFYRCRALDAEQKENLNKYFVSRGFTALNFTDSRSVFQFYNLAYLWQHIQIAVKNDIKLLNIATQPVSAAQIYYNRFGKNFENLLPGQPADYDYKTEYSELFGGRDGYIFGSDFVLKDIAEYVKNRA